ncbi:MAG: tripartite tricarboxylate transporter TctB family protein [Deltaproteobacteria bacterium]|nr:MAG: tripartite tricarboxylate transporter TctB family protein [Deltaproteobacteria bacterium]
MRLGNRVWGIILCAVGIYYLIEGINLPPAAIGDPLGPLVFPTILGLSMIGCGVWLAVRPGPRTNQPVLSRRTFPQVLLLFALLLLYSAAIPWMGYLFSTSLFVFLTSFLMGERSWFKGVAISVIFSAGIFFLFIRVLTIPLPLGFLETLGWK